MGKKFNAEMERSRGTEIVHHEATKKHEEFTGTKEATPKDSLLICIIFIPENELL